MLFGVLPFLQRLADDTAIVVATGDAFDFLEEDELADKGRGVARGIADLRPADRLRRTAEFLHVDILFPGVFPKEFALEMAGFDIHFEVDRRDADDTFEHVQLRACEEGILQRLVGANALGQFGVADTRGIAHAGQDAPRVFLADRVDQLLAQRAEGSGVHEDHPAFAEPDRAVAFAKLDQISQVVGFRITDRCHLVSLPLNVQCFRRHLFLYRQGRRAALAG